MQSDANPQQSGSGMQSSSTDLACLIPPLQMKIRLEDDEVHPDEDAEDNDVLQGLLIPISEEAAVFLEASFQY